MGLLANASRLLTVISALMLAACSHAPIKDLNNVCEIFDKRQHWYDASKDSYEKWGVPIHVQMAILHQESRFKSDAKPPRERLFGFIPWFRPSSAYGYAQVLDQTWEWYEEKNNRSFASRDDFDDVTDFVGWYANLSQRLCGISKWDAYHQYLAYHEGHGGFKRKSFKKKSWLTSVAKKVDRQAKRYRDQLAKCESDFNQFSLWPF